MTRGSLKVVHEMVFGPSYQDAERLVSRIKQVSGIVVEPPVELVTDTTDFARICRGQVLRLEGRDFLVSGDVYEPRFGLEEQPKYWVKRGYDLRNGQRVLIKLAFHEEFVTQVGPLRVRCFRSPEKEGKVLRVVAGDRRFMQGETLVDTSGNNVRVIEFIPGKSLYHTLLHMDIDHEQYYYACLRPILDKVVGCCEAIQMLHEHGLNHGDIRNDHIHIDEQTGEYRWIDFDLCQDSAGFEFDVRSLGKILECVVGMGLTTFHEIRTSGAFPDTIISSLQPEDASAFFAYRIVNLRKVYPYISESLNTILMRFSVGAQTCYSTVPELIQDLQAVLPGIPHTTSWPDNVR